MVHNRYQQPGGEDASTLAESELLRDHGHGVDLLELDNHEIESYGVWQRLALGWRTSWSRRGARLVAEALERHEPELVHFQNTFPLFSPAAYEPCHRRRLPVVQHLRNFRLLCVRATLFRNGETCKLCVGRSPWRGVLHRCYRDSRAQSAAVATMLQLHRWRRTWQRRVHAFVAPSPSARSLLLEAGLPAERVHVKPNFVALPTATAGVAPVARPYVLFVGRLDAEKGATLLLEAWRRERLPELRLVGTGPLEERLRADAAGAASRLELLGRRPAGEVRELMAGALAVVVPSLCLETFGRVVIEAWAQSVPVVASAHGALGELVEHERNGLLVPPADPAALAAAVARLASQPGWARELGAAGREQVARAYGPESNHTQLIRIYRDAVRVRSESDARADRR